VEPVCGWRGAGIVLAFDLNGKRAGIVTR
jgi:hypothetical protein